MLAKRLRHRRAGLDLVLDLHHEARKARVAVAARDDFERLQQRHARLQHRRELAGEERDVLFVDLAPAAERLPLDLDDRMPWRRRLVVTTVSDAARDSPRTWRLLRSMPSQRNVYSLTSFALRQLRWPWFVILVRRCRRHSLVTASISSSEVMPALTLSRPDWRRSRTPSFCAWSAMSSALPLRMMSWRMSSVIGITW